MKVCGECSLCCRLSPIEALQKPGGEWCRHVKPGGGCAIYGRHPEECRTFRCGWLIDSGLGEEWKPSRCHFVIRLDQPLRRLIISNDPDHPDAWKDPRFYPMIKAWARDWGVVSFVGNRATMVYPDQDLDVGAINPGDAVRRGYRDGPEGRAPVILVEAPGETPREYVGRYGTV